MWRGSMEEKVNEVRPDGEISGYNSSLIEMFFADGELNG